jgi:ubiquinol oxidase
MKEFNSLVLNLTVSILDFLYKGKDIQRFWVLETIARAPYFAFLSVLHFKESLGLRTESHFYLMKEHFAQTVNETEHLTEMELRGGANRWVDRFLAYHLVLVYYWIMVVYYFIAPVSAYHLNEEVEWHAMETYGKYLLDNPDDEVIANIMLDEINHALELHKAMELIV